METKMVIIPVNELRVCLLEIISEAETLKEQQKKEKENNETLYSVNQVARRLKRAHVTIKRLIAQGLIKTTPDGRISEKSINDYLLNN